MGVKYPPIVHQFAEGKDAYNLVLGAMLGGYLALTISEKGLKNGNYGDLAFCLIFCCLFALTVNLIGDRFHRRSYRAAVAYVIFAISSAAGAMRTGPNLGIDTGILATIILVWAAMIAFEIATASVALFFGTKTND